MCVVAISTFPANVAYYTTDESANSAGVSDRCSVVSENITQEYNKTCSLKCNEGYKGKPLLYCAAGNNKAVVSGSPEYQNQTCTGTCDRLL